MFYKFFTTYCIGWNVGTCEWSVVYQIRFENMVNDAQKFESGIVR